jgi:hypothetical protein
MNAASRLKVLQLVATGAAAIPLLMHIRGEHVQMGEIAGSVLLTTFAGTACWSLWFYGQRYVGEMALAWDLDAHQIGSNEAPFVATGEYAPVGGARPRDISAEVGRKENGVLRRACAEHDKISRDEGINIDGHEAVATKVTGQPWLRMSTLDFWGRRQVQPRTSL